MRKQSQSMNKKRSKRRSKKKTNKIRYIIKSNNRILGGVYKRRSAMNYLKRRSSDIRKKFNSIFKRFSQICAREECNNVVIDTNRNITRNITETERVLKLFCNDHIKCYAKKENGEDCTNIRYRYDIDYCEHHAYLHRQCKDMHKQKNELCRKQYACDKNETIESYDIKLANARNCLQKRKDINDICFNNLTNNDGYGKNHKHANMLVEKAIENCTEEKNATTMRNTIDSIYFHTQNY